MGRLTSTILQDLMSVLGSRQNSDLVFKMTATIYAGGFTFKPYTLDSLLVLKDFVNESFDRLELFGEMPAGQYAKELYENRDVIDVELKLDYLYMRGSESLDVSTFPPLVRTYKAQLADIKDDKASANRQMDNDPDLADLDAMRAFRLLLTDRGKDTVLHSTIGTVVRRSSTQNAIKGIMTAVFNGMGLSQEEAVKGVDVAPGASTDEHEHILIPHAMEVLGIPKYLQEKEYGVYAGGIGAYIQDNVCYVYPPYDVDQVKKGARTLTILNILNDAYPGAESTWARYDEDLYIVATDKTIITDPTEQYQMALGAGVQYVNADALMRVGSTVSDGKLTINGNKNTVKTSVLSRRDEFNFLMPGTKPITANHLHENSQLLARNGAVAKVIWENAKIGEIKPGQAVRFITLDGTGVKEYHGVVHNVFHNVQPKTNTFTERLFGSTAALELFITYDPVDEYDLPA